MGIEDLLARVEDLDGTARHHGELGRAELQVERLALAAERAPERRLHDAHAVDRDAEDARELPVHVVRDLGRGVHGEHAAGFPDADGAVRFESRVGAAGKLVLPVDDDVAAGELAIDVAERELDVLGDVAVLREVVDLGGVRSHRFRRVEHVRQHLPGDVDELRRASGRRLVDGCDRGDAVPDVERAVHGERVFVLRPGEDPVPDGHVRPGDDRVHAG